MLQSVLFTERLSRTPTQSPPSTKNLPGETSLSSSPLTGLLRDSHVSPGAPRTVAPAAMEDVHPTDPPPHSVGEGTPMSRAPPPSRHRGMYVPGQEVVVVSTRVWVRTTGNGEDLTVGRPARTPGQIKSFFFSPCLHVTLTSRNLWVPFGFCTAYPSGSRRHSRLPLAESHRRTDV